MALTRKVLYFGQLASAKADIYVPSGVKGFVHNLTIHNTGVTTEKVVLYYNDGANEYKFINVDINSNETLFIDFRGEGFVVEDGEKITGNTDTVTTVTIKIDGTEEA